MDEREAVAAEPAAAEPERAGAGGGAAELGQVARSAHMAPSALLALQRAAGNRASTRLLQRQSMVSGVSVTDVPGETHHREIRVNGTRVLTVDLPQGGSVALSHEYEPGQMPALSVLRIKLLAPVGARVLLDKAAYREVMDRAADRWSIRVDQETRPDPEAHVEGGPWIQEVTSDPPPPPKAAWTPPPAKPAPPPLKPKPERAAEPPPPSKLDVVRRHTLEHRWDTDDLAAELGNDDLIRLTPEERVALIAEIADGLVVGDEDETTIDRLLETTPVVDAGEVRALLVARPSLLERLDSVIDGEEYTRYLKALTAILVNPVSEGDLLDAIGRAPEIPWSGAGFHAGLSTYRATWTDKGTIKIESWHGFVAAQMQVADLELAPGDLVVVRFDHDEPEADAKAGTFRPMPAAAFMGLVHMKFKRDVWLAINVAFVVGGVGGVIGGATRLARLLATLDVALNAANIAVEAYRAQIAATDRGRAFLKAWDTVQMVIAVYGLARVAMKLPQAIRNARDLWKAARGAVLGQGSTTAANEVEKNLAKLEQGLEGAQQEAKLHPPGEEPPASAKGGAEPEPATVPHEGAPPESARGAAEPATPPPAPAPPPPRKVTLMHGTDQKGFEGVGGLGEGKIDVTHQPGAHQDFGRGFYLATDEETARAYARTRNLQKTAGKGGGMTHVLQYDVAPEDLGSVVDIRPGGKNRAAWDAFLDSPFKLPGGGTIPGFETQGAYLSKAPERRGAIFETFLREIGMTEADVVVGPLGDRVFTGITAGKETTQVCIRSQSAADKLNAIMRGAGR